MGINNISLHKKTPGGFNTVVFSPVPNNTPSRGPGRPVQILSSKLNNPPARIPGVPIQGKRPTITREQFKRLLESDPDAFEVCCEFFKSSPMLEDKSKIVDIAVGARHFATERIVDSIVQKGVILSYAVLGWAMSAGAGVMHQPLLLLSWIPHALMIYGILNAARFLSPDKVLDETQKKYIVAPYVSKFPPFFKSKDGICDEIRRYLEYREFSEYRISLAGKPVEEVEVTPPVQIDETEICRRQLASLLLRGGVYN